MATVPSPRTWVTGEVVTAAYMNGLRDTDLFLLGGAAGQRPKFQAQQNAAQSINTSAETAINFQSVVTDTDSAYNTGTFTYTVATSGFWMFHACVTFASNTGGIRAIRIGNINARWGTMVASSDPNNTGSVEITHLAQVASGLSLSVTAFQTSGAALNTGGDSKTVYSAVWLCS